MSLVRMSARPVLVAILLGACAHPAAHRQRSAAGVTDSPTHEAARPLQAAPGPEPPAEVAAEPVDFARDVRPILESRCQPCHFAGGRMYVRLPFDQPQTIRQLGTRLFTRIKDEPSQTTILRFLDQAR